MKARIIAIIILLILIGLPVLGYWYFFVKNISGITIEITENTPAEVELSGKFSYSWLPLANHALNFKSHCQQKCTFSPIAPAQYTVKITFNSNYESIQDFIELKNGEQKIQKYTPKEAIQKQEIKIQPPKTTDEKIFIQRDIKKSFGENIELLGIDINGNIWILEEQNSALSIAKIENGQKKTLATWNFFPTEKIFDYYNSTIILKNNQSGIIFSLESGDFIEAIIPENTIGARKNKDEWQIITSKEALTLKRDKWRKNPRFTHYMDSGNWRIGFISKNDTETLSLSNYQSKDGGILIALNRVTGEVREIQKNIDISEIFLHKNFVIIGQNGQFYYFLLP